MCSRVYTTYLLLTIVVEVELPVKRARRSAKVATLLERDEDGVDLIVFDDGNKENEAKETASGQTVATQQPQKQRRALVSLPNTNAKNCEFKSAGPMPTGDSTLTSSTYSSDHAVNTTTSRCSRQQPEDAGVTAPCHVGWQAVSARNPADAGDTPHAGICANGLPPSS